MKEFIKKNKNWILFVALIMIVANIDHKVLGATVTPEQKALCESFKLGSLGSGLISISLGEGYQKCISNQCGVQVDTAGLNEAWCVVCVPDQQTALGTDKGCCSGNGKNIGEVSDKTKYLCLPESQISDVEKQIGGLVNEVTGLDISTKSAAWVGIGIGIMAFVLIISVV